MTSRIQKLRRYGVLWLLAIAYLAVRVRYLGGFALSLERPEFGTRDLPIAALALMGRYLWKLLWPVELCAYFLFPADVSALHSKALWGAVALAICALILRGALESQPAGRFWNGLAAFDSCPPF